MDPVTGLKLKLLAATAGVVAGVALLVAYGAGWV